MRKRSDEFSFDLAKFIFHQPSRVYKMRIQERRTGIPGQEKQSENVLLDLYTYSAYSISMHE